MMAEPAIEPMSPKPLATVELAEGARRADRGPLKLSGMERSGMERSGMELSGMELSGMLYLACAVTSVAAGLGAYGLARSSANPFQQALIAVGALAVWGAIAFLVVRRLEQQLGRPFAQLLAVFRKFEALSGGKIRFGMGRPEEIVSFASSIEGLLTQSREQEAVLEAALEAAQEEALEEAKRHHEQRLHERALEVDRAKAAMLIAERSKNEFLAKISRQLRTPLAGVVGYTDLLLGRPLPEENRKLATGIAVAGDALLSVVDNLRDFSRIETDELTIEREDFDPRSLIEGVVEALAPRAREKNLGLSFEVADALPKRVRQDPERLRQVLFHLVDNAIQFTPTGSVKIRLDTGVIDKVLRLQFTVRDTGVGIPAEAMAKLFEPFTQVDGSPAQRRQGSGLGLAISQRIVRKMGGELRAASVFGAGSTFLFEVPCEPCRDARPDPLARSSEPEEARTRCKILLVEDNWLNRQFVTQQLRVLGHESIAAANGHEAMALYDSEVFDLVLMDCQMPGLDGYETTRSLRQQEGTGRRTPIVAITADAMSGDRERCLAAGMDDYLVKPFRSRELKTVMARWLPAALENVGPQVAAERSADAVS